MEKMYVRIDRFTFTALQEMENGNWWCIVSLSGENILWKTDLEFHYGTGAGLVKVGDSPGWFKTRKAALEVVRKYRDKMKKENIQVVCRPSKRWR